MSSRLLKLIGIAAIRWVTYTYQFQLVVCNCNISMLHIFQDVTTFTVYETVCDLEKSFSIDYTAEIASHVLSPIRI